MILSLQNFAPTILAAEPHLWAEAVRRCLPKIRVLAVSGNKKFFQDSSGPDGNPWPPLAHPRPGGGTSKPLLDTGLLRASISASVTEDGIKLTASRAGANVQNFGGLIRPKKGKYLAIPISKEAKRAGSPRNNFPRPLFVVGVNDEKAYLAENKQKGKQKINNLIFHYVLVKSVRIPPRRFVGFSRPTLDRIAQTIGAEYNKVLIEMFSGKFLG